MTAATAAAITAATATAITAATTAMPAAAAATPHGPPTPTRSPALPPSDDPAAGPPPGWPPARAGRAAGGGRRWTDALSGGAQTLLQVAARDCFLARVRRCPRQASRRTCTLASVRRPPRGATHPWWRRYWRRVPRTPMRPLSSTRLLPIQGRPGWPRPGDDRAAGCSRGRRTRHRGCWLHAPPLGRPGGPRHGGGGATRGGRRGQRGEQATVGRRRLVAACAPREGYARRREPSAWSGRPVCSACCGGGKRTTDWQDARASRSKKGQ